jgi:hypothetical protein
VHGALPYACRLASREHPASHPRSVRSGQCHLPAGEGCAMRGHRGAIEVPSRCHRGAIEVPSRNSDRVRPTVTLSLATASIPSGPTGITLRQYGDLLAAQGGVCAICRHSERMVGGRHGSTPLRLSVDHDHGTKAVRGLLCSACPQGIGLCRHDISLLQAASEYLRLTENTYRPMSRCVRR